MIFFFDSGLPDSAPQELHVEIRDDVKPAATASQEHTAAILAATIAEYEAHPQHRPAVLQDMKAHYALFIVSNGAIV